MLGNDRWQLPQGVEELLPQRAAALETLRRKLLGEMRLRGYRLVSPPMIEYLEALLTGTGTALQNQTYKVSDAETGRSMGVRADITPQVARIDAHYLNDSEVNRLCYAGSVVRTRSRTPGGAREEMQLGAELFGVQEMAADCEVIDTMLALLSVVGVEQPTLALGHVGVFRELARMAELDDSLQRRVLRVFQQFSIPDMDQLVASEGERLQQLRSLMELAGDSSVLEQARQVLPADGALSKCFEQLEGVCAFLAQTHPQLNVHIDLGNLRGYQYHTGIVFEGLAPGLGLPLANGGRYDAIGADFGRSRPATGFSVELRALLALTETPSAAGDAILAPWPQDTALRSRVEALRAQGETVINQLPGVDGSGCDRTLTEKNGEWQVEPL